MHTGKALAANEGSSRQSPCSVDPSLKTRRYHRYELTPADPRTEKLEPRTAKPGLLQLPNFSFQAQICGEPLLGAILLEAPIVVGRGEGLMTNIPGGKLRVSKASSVSRTTWSMKAFHLGSLERGKYDVIARDNVQYHQLVCSSIGRIWWMNHLFCLCFLPTDVHEYRTPAAITVQGFRSGLWRLAPILDREKGSEHLRDSKDRASNFDICTLSISIYIQCFTKGYEVNRLSTRIMKQLAHRCTVSWSQTPISRSVS
jgi:hypothetical protein